MTELIDTITETLAEHFYFALDPHRCAGCGHRLPCEGEAADEHRAHIAAVLADLPALKARTDTAVEAALADAWDEGKVQGMQFGTKADNPYRIAANLRARHPAGDRG